MAGLKPRPFKARTLYYTPSQNTLLRIKPKRLNTRLECSIAQVRLGLDAEGELFDDGVGENLAGDAFDLGLGLGTIEAVFEGEEEVFALADVSDALVVHATERSGYGLALGVEDGGL